MGRKRKEIGCVFTEWKLRVLELGETKFRAEGELKFGKVRRLNLRVGRGNE